MGNRWLFWSVRLGGLALLLGAGLFLARFFRQIGLGEYSLVLGIVGVIFFIESSWYVARRFFAGYQKRKA